MNSVRLFPFSQPSASSSAANELTQRNNPLFDAAFYASRYRLADYEQLDLYKHYVYVGRFNGFDPNEYFNTSWYLNRYKDVRTLRIDPLDHYLERGAEEGRNPSPAFSSSLYRLLYPDVEASGVNPLLHFLNHGRQEGRIAPPVALLPSMSVMSDPAAVVGIDPRLIASARPIVVAVSRWITLLSRMDEIAAREIAETVQSDAHIDAAVAEFSTHGRNAPGDPHTKIGHRCSPVWPVRHRSRRTAKPGSAQVIEYRSPWLARVFAAIFARDLSSSFDAIRLLGRLPLSVEGPVVLLTNHPSWWDVELFHWLGATHFADRRSFAPMNAAHLAKHRILERLGAFPVRSGSFTGAAAFLTTAERVLQESDALLFVAVEGRFRDVRERPIQPMPGVVHLARRIPEATFIPLAIDYVFWSERRPNLLLRFGEPVRAGALVGDTAVSTAYLASALGTAMSALAEAGQSRQPRRFSTLLERRGGVSVSAFYDLWQILSSLLLRRVFPQRGTAKPRELSPALNRRED